jgi:hypothetical protein
VIAHFLEIYESWNARGWKALSDVRAGKTGEPGKGGESLEISTGGIWLAAVPTPEPARRKQQ